MLLNTVENLRNYCELEGTYFICYFPFLYREAQELEKSQSRLKEALRWQFLVVRQ